MKRIKWIPALMLVLLSFAITICSAAGSRRFYYDGAFHEYTGNVYKLKVNNVLLSPPIPPIIFSDYSVVPARAVFQDGLGAKVSWDGVNQKVTVSMDDVTLILKINDTTAYINSEKVTMPIPAKIINDYTVIPARFVAEHLNMKVDFDETSGTILLSRSDAKKTVSVTDVAYSNKSRTEGVLTLTTKSDNPKYNAFILTDPLRLVVDVTDGAYAKTPSTISVKKANLEQIRFGQQEDSARVVIDLTKNLGYTVKTNQNKVVVTIKLDSSLQSEDEDEETIVTKPKDPVEKPKEEKPEEEKPEEPSFTEYVTYSYNDAKDTIRINASVGTPVKNGSIITVPVYDSLSSVSGEKAVTGYFGKKMSYTPAVSGKGGTLTITLKSSDTVMNVSGKTIVLSSVYKDLPRSVMLDAGHGGADGGAIAYNEDGTIKAKEKDFNLDVVLRAKELLEAEGVTVYTIRTEDVYVDYLKVGGIANKTDSTLFVSVHTNSATTTQAHGIETFGYLNAGSVSNGMTGEKLSKILLDELIKKTGAHNRGVKDGKTLAVINSTQMPATLIEIGFISNEEECEKMMTEEYRQTLAEAVCDAVLAAFDVMEI